MQQFIIRLSRWSKRNFLRLRLHLVFSPFADFFINAYYMIRFSEWVSKNRNLPHNDFYSPKFDSNKRYDTYAFVKSSLELANEPILFLEFGVFNGASFRWWVEHNKHRDSRFVGFDTFEGLPEAWKTFKAGDMSAEGKFPDIQDSRVTFVKGLFQNTLLGFLRKEESLLSSTSVKVISLDADLYTSTIYVLACLYPYLKAGDVLIMDEFGVPTHEFKAITEFFEAFYLKYEVLAASNNYYQLAIRIIE